MDGQVVETGKPFKVPNPGGDIDRMLCTHDPKDPPEQMINCGCTAAPHMKSWMGARRPWTRQPKRRGGGRNDSAGAVAGYIALNPFHAVTP